MAIASGFFLPLLKIVGKRVYDLYSSDTVSEELKSSWISQRIAKVAPLGFRDFYAHPSSLYPNEISSECVDDTEMRGVLLNVAPLFQRDRYVVRVIGLLAVLISFGVVFPPLGVMVALAIISITYFEQLVIGRILCESKRLGYEWYRMKMEIDVKGMGERIRAAIFPMVMTASLLFGALVFDTIGDEGGFEPALATSLVLVLLPPFVFVSISGLEYCKSSYRSPREADESSYPRNKSVVELPTIVHSPMQPVSVNTS
jgi:hypothetical protein